MMGAADGRPTRLRWVAKKMAFAFLRARQPVYALDGRQSGSGLRLRVLHVGDRFRGHYFLERLYGNAPEPRLVSRAVVTPRANRALLPGGYDLYFVEINRLYARAYRRAGYFTIPEWVEFGREVVEDESARYAAASKSLRTDLRAVRNAAFEVAISRAEADFEVFYQRMWLPYISNRFGDGAITKPRQRLKKDFRAGFLILLCRAAEPVAGALVRVDGERVSLTTLGVLDGSPELLRSHVSGVIDYHLHAWAAANGKRYINVGHTRPFPQDGVFFNKRKWLMSITPDRDGVTSMALTWARTDSSMIRVLRDYPFVYEGDSGLGVLCVHSVPRRLDANEARKVVKRYWTPGLRSLIAVCPGGLQPDVVDYVRELGGGSVHFCSDLGSAVRLYRAGVQAPTSRRRSFSP
jgi:hypothetical protein